MRNYANSIIYKLCCNDASITDIYIGSTTNFVKRKQGHKNGCNNINNNRHNVNVYQFIRANGGWTSWSMVEVERFNAIDKRNLLTRERYWLETLKATLNSQIPTRTQQEWCEDNKQKITEQQKQYRIENKQKFNQYRNDNKTKIIEQKKQYYIDNNQPITCLCGAVTRRSDKTRHLKTKKYDFAHNLHIFIHS